MAFNKEAIEALYPEAGELMWEPMLMWKLPSNKEDQFEEICGNGDYFASIKKDGLCYQFVKTEHHSYLFGRTVSKTTGLLTEKIANVPHIEAALGYLPANTVIVFEIYYPGKTSKGATPIMGCLPELAIQRQKDNPILGYAHDILMYDGVDLRKVGALTRYNILVKIWEIHGLAQYKFLELAQPIFNNIYEEGMAALARGEEGLVLRKKTGTWEPGKRPAWNTIKFKQNDSIDLVCTRIIPATKEYTGKEIETWPYWASSPTDDGLTQVSLVSCYGQEGWYPVTKLYALGLPGAIGIGGYDDDGELVEIGTVSSGLTDYDRENLRDDPEHYIGRPVKLGCMSIDKKERTLRHPTFREWHDDKNASYCKLSDIFK